MLVKVVLVFLVLMAALAIFGRLRLPGIGRSDPRKCSRCGRFLIGKGPCDCRRTG
jgi:hypothetical protein